MPRSTVTPLNPYVVGGALSDPSGRGFYGRKDIFNFVRSSLAVEQRGPILLYGQRRIGKSSILRQLPNHLPSDLVCIYFDLQGKASMELDQVLYGLARSMTERLNIPKPTREEAGEETFHREFFQRALAAVDGEARRLVLLFDEFDVVDEKLVGGNVAARRFIGYLTDLTSAEPELGCILVVGRRTEELSPGFNAALIKNSLQHKIGRLSERECSQLIKELAVDYLNFEPKALSEIYSLTAGHPFCTQVLCNTIWSRYVNDESEFPIQITFNSVMETLPLAIERGTTGLNWSFDGVTNPTQRLFLSAMAGELTRENKPVPMVTIERSLRSRQIGVDTAELARAPQELEGWDIVVKSNEGFRFAVPMIGLWIKKERPLEQLMSEARFSNPQAYQYYELGVQAHQKGDFERAVLDYRGAIEANPVFVEAYRGLAAALVEGSGAAGLDEAIEINERILEINSEESTTTLLDLVSRRLDEPASVDQHLKLYDRIGQLEAEGYMQSRARRQLQKIGFNLMNQNAFSDAARVFEKLDDKELVEGALSRAQSFQQRLWLWWGFAGASLVAVLLISLLAPDLMTSLRPLRAGVLLLAILGGFAVSTAFDIFWRSRKMVLVGASQSASKRPRSPIPQPAFLVTILVFATIYFFMRSQFKWYEPATILVIVAYISAIVGVENRKTDLANTPTPAKHVIKSADSQGSTSQGSSSGTNTD